MAGSYLQGNKRDITPAELSETAISRRSFVAASAGAIGGTVLLRHSAAGQATPSAEGPWSFTDDRGRTVDLPARPKNVIAEVAVGATLWDFGYKETLAVFGSDIHGQDDRPATVAGRMDLDQVKFAGSDMANLDLEMLVSLDPDILLGTVWDSLPDSLGGYAESALGGLPQIAPSLAIRVVEAPVSVPLARFAELAAALGVDLNAPDMVVARTAFEAASEDVSTAAAEEPGLKVLALFAGENGLYVANPTVASDLMYFMELGVEFVVPTDPGPEMSGFWEQLSWEQVNKYQADLMLADDRTFSMTPAQLMEQPTFKTLPAAIANQIGPWSVEYVISYQGLTTVLLALAESIRSAQVLTS